MTDTHEHELRHARYDLLDEIRATDDRLRAQYLRATEALVGVEVTAALAEAAKAAADAMNQLEQVLRTTCTHADTGRWFDREICPSPCGAMHTRCRTCGRPTDPCPFEPKEEI